MNTALPVVPQLRLDLTELGDGLLGEGDGPGTGVVVALGVHLGGGELDEIGCRLLGGRGGAAHRARRRP